MFVDFKKKRNLTISVWCVDMKPEEEDELERRKREAKTLQEVRKTLPVYPYREEFLYAVERYQVHIHINKHTITHSFSHSIFLLFVPLIHLHNFLVLN